MMPVIAAASAVTIQPTARYSSAETGARRNPAWKRPVNEHQTRVVSGAVNDEIFSATQRGIITPGFLPGTGHLTRNGARQGSGECKPTNAPPLTS